MTSKQYRETCRQSKRLTILAWKAIWLLMDGHITLGECNRAAEYHSRRAGALGHKLDNPTPGLGF